MTAPQQQQIAAATNQTQQNTIMHASNTSFLDMTDAQYNENEPQNDQSSQQTRDLIDYTLCYMVAHQQTIEKQNNYTNIIQEMKNSGIINRVYQIQDFNNAEIMRDQLKAYNIDQKMIKTLSVPIISHLSGQVKFFQENYQKLDTEPLGKGAFGEVWRCENQQTKQVYAIKVLAMPSNTLIVDSTLQEIRILLTLQSPYVVRYYNAWSEAEELPDMPPDSQDGYTSFVETARIATFNDFFAQHQEYAYQYAYPTQTYNEYNEAEVVDSKLPESKEYDYSTLGPVKKFLNVLYIQMEFCKNQSLRELCYPKNRIQAPLDQDKLYDLTFELLYGLQYIHRQNVIHRDIKPENVLLGDGLHIKYGDFGIAVDSDDVTQKALGTKVYMAPEAFKANENSERQDKMKLDVYALGITIYELWGGFPYQDRWNEINKLKIDGIKESFRKKCPVIANLITKMIDSNVTKRYSIQQCLQIPEIMNLQKNLEKLVASLCLDSRGASQSENRASIIDSLFKYQQVPVVINDAKQYSKELLDLFVLYQQKAVWERFVLYNQNLKELASQQAQLLGQFGFINRGDQLMIDCTEVPIMHAMSYELRGKHLYESIYRAGTQQNPAYYKCLSLVDVFQEKRSVGVATLYESSLNVLSEIISPQLQTRIMQKLGVSIQTIRFHFWSQLSKLFDTAKKLRTQIKFSFVEVADKNELKVLPCQLFNLLSFKMRIDTCKQGTDILVGYGGIHQDQGCFYIQFTYII